MLPSSESCATLSIAFNPGRLSVVTARLGAHLPVITLCIMNLMHVQSQEPSISVSHWYKIDNLLAVCTAP